MKTIHKLAKATLLAVVCATLGALNTPAALAQGGKVVEAVLYASPEVYEGACPGVIKFFGKITTDGPATVVYRFERSDGAIPPLQTLVFDAAGTKEVSGTWTLGGAVLPTYGGWEQIGVSEPNKFGSNRAAFKLSCKAAQPGGKAPQMPNGKPRRAGNVPNLVTKVTGLPSEASAGGRLGDALEVRGENVGGGVAGGTIGGGGTGGYMIDLVLSRTPVTSNAFASYSANYTDGVLLQGGRVSRTEDLGAGGVRVYTGELRGAVVIPADTPSGIFYLCAVIDPGDRVRESDERDNIACEKLRIKGRDAADGQAPPE